VRRKAGRVECVVRQYRRSPLLQRRPRKRKLKINNVEALSIAAVLCLFVAIAPLPIGYYTFLRVLVTVAALANAYYAFSKNSTLWIAVFILIAVLFNPVFPVYLYKKSLWMPVNIITGILFLSVIVNPKKNKNH